MPRRTVGGSGKKSPLNMRTTEALRRKLEMAAGLSGRSLVQGSNFDLNSHLPEKILAGWKSRR